MKATIKKSGEAMMGAAQVQRVVSGFIAMPFKKKVKLLKKAGLLKATKAKPRAKSRPKAVRAR